MLLSSLQLLTPLVLLFIVTTSTISIKNAVLKNLAILIGKQLCWSLFLIIWRFTSRQLYYKETPTQVFSCEYCKIFIKVYFKGHLWTTASDLHWFKVEDIVIEKTETYLESNETSKVKLFAKIVDCN